jgi:hypothetical protein
LVARLCAAATLSFEKNSASVLVAKKIVGTHAGSRELRAELVALIFEVLLGFNFESEAVSRESRTVIHLGGSLRDFHTREEHLNDGISGALEISIAFALRNPGEETVKNIPRQTIMKEDCQPLDRNPAITQFIPMIFKHSSDERSCFRRAVRVPRFTDFRTVRCLSDGEPMEIH